MTDQGTWEEFRAAGLLWWVNRSLHIFGWAIVTEVNMDTDEVIRVYPARVDFRGFDREQESDGHTKLTKYLGLNIESLLDDVREVR